MSSIRVGIGSLFRTSMTAMLDAIASTGVKAVVATIEDKTKKPEYLAKQCIIDEGPETFWKAAFGSVLAKLKNHFAPFIPEQFVNIPGDLLGALTHWKSASHQSLNKITVLAGNKLEKIPKFIDKFFDKCIKTPTNFILKLIGFNKDEDTISFARFGISNVVAFIFGTLALRGSEGENMPGVNLDSSESKSVSILKTLGYTVTEQITHILSQWMRYWEDYFKKNENDTAADLVDKKYGKAKALANTINEKTFPGNIFSALGACLSTLWLGKYIPKSAAGALGEIIPKGLTRLLETRLRRSTKDTYDENAENNRAPNYRFHDVKWFNKTLDIMDYPFKLLREATINHIVAPLFKPDELTLDQFRKELFDSFNLSEEALKRKKEIKNGNGDSILQPLENNSTPRVVIGVT